jgi:hypothetical protein
MTTNFMIKVQLIFKHFMDLVAMLPTIILSISLDLMSLTQIHFAFTINLLNFRNYC